MRKYIYKPLDKPTSEFRLLRISKHPLIDLPQCSLQKYSLTDCPGYTALSYTWGKPTATYRVAIEGANIEVRQNLFDFLDAYTTEPWGMDNAERPVFYWIDQICINQEDPIERSGQVRIMDKIYRQANMVLIWLGCDPDMIEAVRGVQENVDIYKERAIDTLLDHPYFSRIWIIQEVALSVNAPLFICGGIELNWYLVRFWIAPSRRISQARMVMALERGRTRERRTLKDCIWSHCTSDCHDPRDKVYGLLGLTPEKWRVHVDYTKEVLEVYFDAVAALSEELFDRLDPECFYPEDIADSDTRGYYCNTLFLLGHTMGLRHEHHDGRLSFLKYVQTAYLSTQIRNVQYTYTGRICTRVPAQSSSELITASEEEEFEFSWGSITATRRNPLLRDIIPEMGLQLASPTTGSTAGQSDKSVSVVDRWWCKHDGEIHYFNCTN